MVKITFTCDFDHWLEKLKDRRARLIIQHHIDRMAEGNLGHVRSVGQGIHEKKIYYGSGYRLYFYNRADCWIILLCGGDKSTQQSDTQKAKMMKKGLL